jgi:LPXTG-motif cell wall-anchored protein
MSRATTIAAVIAAPLLALAATGTAFAGLSGGSLALTHSPDQFTVGEEGTLTATLSDQSQSARASQLPLNDYVVSDEVPASFDVGTIDEGDYSCEYKAAPHAVDCEIESRLESPESFTFHVTPSQVGEFDNNASYEFTNVPQVRKGNAATPSVQGQSATDPITVVAAATPTPTSTPTPSETPTPKPPPSKTPTHKPTHKPTVKPTKTSRPVPPVLPDTGGPDEAILAAVGALLVSAGAFTLGVTRRRRT